MHRLLSAVLALAFLAGSALAQRNAKVPDPDPEVERKTFQVADGFEVTLFAADPMLAKPIQMSFDPAGRLWVACSEAYPQIKPGAAANDKIVVLEDTKGTGKADKVTVFADGLLIPTGIEPGDGGAYVANSTEILHLADTDGDGKADRQRVVLSGFGTEDTHHIVHTFRWGPDGCLYFNQAIYIHSHIETPHGPRRLNAGGIWRLRPETLQLEVFARGWVNAWGHHFDDFGQSFVTDGAGGDGINSVVPGGYYASSQGPNASRILTGLNPGSPKYCGEEIASGRHLPEDWRGNIITNDFRGHRVVRFAIKEERSGFFAQQLPDLIRSTHPAFRPIDVKMGPDGAIYIADWYNPIIQHGEVDFRDPRRDVTHGRIWRVTAKGRPLVERPKLVGATVEALLEHLKAPEQWTRHFAKRVLKERGAAEVQPALAKWVAQQTDERHLLEGLWTYESLDIVESALLDRLSRAKDGRIRAAAVRTLVHWVDRLPEPLTPLARAVTDDHPRVRLEAVRACAAVPKPAAVEVAMRALDKPVDPLIDYALWLTARELDPVWKPALASGELRFGGNLTHLMFALRASDARAAVPALAALAKAGRVPAEQQEMLYGLLASQGGSGEMDLVLDRVFADGLAVPIRANLLATLAQAMKDRNVRPSGEPGRLVKLLEGKDEALTASAARLAGAWKATALAPKLEALAKGNGSDVLKRSAIEGLAAMGSRDTLDRLAGSALSPGLRRQTIVALVPLDPAGSAKRAVEVLTTPDAGDADLFAAFAQQKGGPEALAKELAGKKLPADVAKIGLRAAKSGGRESPALVAALTKAGGLDAPKQAPTAATIQQLTAEALKLGNAQRGEIVYRRKELTCLKCHALAGAGGRVGPDLMSLGASAQPDYIVEALLLPNKAVKEGFHTVKVETTDGKVYVGIKVRETPVELVIRDAEDKEIVIPKKKIEDQANAASLMPDGLIDSLTRGELLDLVKFMTDLGKVGGPYAVTDARIARRWEVLETTSQAYTPLYRIGIHAPTTEPGLTWSPFYATATGSVPLDELPRFTLTRKLEQSTQVVAFARTQLDVAVAGKARLKLNDPTGVQLWLDRMPVEAKAAMDVDLPAGVRTLTLAIDPTKRSSGVRLELADVPGSPARAKVVGGK